MIQGPRRPDDETADEHGQAGGEVSGRVARGRLARGAGGERPGASAAVRRPSRQTPTGGAGDQPRARGGDQPPERGDRRSPRRPGWGEVRGGGAESRRPQPAPSRQEGAAAPHLV